jgi:hypothetical protein
VCRQLIFIKITCHSAAFNVAKVTLLRQKNKPRHVLQDNTSTKPDCPLMEAGSSALGE